MTIKDQGMPLHTAPVQPSEAYTPVSKYDVRAAYHRVRVETTRGPDGRIKIEWTDLTNHYVCPEKLGVLGRVLAMFLVLPVGAPVAAFAVADPTQSPLVFGGVMASIWGLMVPVSRAQKAWARRMRLQEVRRTLVLEPNGAMLLVGAFPHSVNPREVMEVGWWQDVASVEVSNGQNGGLLMVGWEKRFATRETVPADLHYVTIYDRRGGISVISESFWDQHNARQIAVAVSEAVQAMRRT